MGAPDVYKAINNVMAEIAKVGIAKDLTAKGAYGGEGGYQYRGIDAVYDVMSAALSKHGLVIIPRLKDRVCVERTTSRGTTLSYTTVTVEYELVSASDGSSVTAVVPGEAMDSGAHSTAKAMSYAYKAMAFEVFCIPLSGEDAEKDDPGPVLASPEQMLTELRYKVKSVGGTAKAYDLLKAKLSSNDIEKMADIAEVKDAVLLGDLIKILDDAIAASKKDQPAKGKEAPAKTEAPKTEDAKSKEGGDKK